MKVGTKSVLFGAHCFFIHPFLVARAWHTLYGFPWDPRLWVAFFVHDLGYWGKPNMDGPEGESHVEFGARVMERLFGKEWGDFCRYHSRFYAKRDGKPYSRLCVADKYSFHLNPQGLYIWATKLTGEVFEYMKDAREGKYKGMQIGTAGYDIWFTSTADKMKAWALAHRDGAEDTWTKVQ